MDREKEATFYIRDVRWYWSCPKTFWFTVSYSIEYLLWLLYLARQKAVDYLSAISDSSTPVSSCNQCMNKRTNVINNVQLHNLRSSLILFNQHQWFFTMPMWTLNTDKLLSAINLFTFIQHNVTPGEKELIWSIIPFQRYLPVFLMIMEAGSLATSSTREMLFEICSPQILDACYLLHHPGNHC